MNTFYEKYRVATWKLQVFGLLKHTSLRGQYHEQVF
jgi:hypothetical protein